MGLQLMRYRARAGARKRVGLRSGGRMVESGTGRAGTCVYVAGRQGDASW